MTQWWIGFIDGFVTAAGTVIVVLFFLWQYLMYKDRQAERDSVSRIRCGTGRKEKTP